MAKPPTPPKSKRRGHQPGSDARISPRPVQPRIGSLLESILEHTHILIAYLDPKFNFIMVNRAYAEADARKPSFFPGKNHFELYPNPENKKIFERVVKRGKPYIAYAKPFEYAEHPERGVSYWDWSLVPTKNEKGRVIGLVLSLADVTQRIKAEEERRKLSRAVEQSPATVIITDPEGTIEYVNRKFTELTGFSRAEVIGKRPSLLKSGKQAPEFYRELWSTIKKGRDWRGEFCNKKKNGALYWESALISPLKDENGSVTHFIGIKEDITSQKEAQEELHHYRHHLEDLVEKRTRELRKKMADYRRATRELREAEMRYRTVADFTFDWEYWEAPDGTYNFVSPSVAGITRYKAVEFIKNPQLINKIILPEDLGVWNRHHQKMLKTRRSEKVQFRIKTRDGKVLWIEHACRAVLDQKGRYLGRRATNRDITERIAAAAEVQRNRDELSHVGRVATLGELTAAITHEINQPLTAIMGNAQAARRFLEAESPDLEELKEIMSEIATEDRRASEIITRIRSLLQREKLELKPVDINEVVQDVVSLLRSDAVIKNITVKTDLAPRLPHVLGDRIQLQQVLLNLMVNGFDAMTRQESKSRDMVIRTDLGNAGTLQVDVRDSGPGVREDDLPKVFRPFFTTKPGGMGMGLSINKRIIEAHQGKIWAANNAAGGSTFSFTLPVGRERSK